MSSFSPPKACWSKCMLGLSLFLSLSLSVYIYIPIDTYVWYIHTYRHTCIHTCIHTYIHTHTHTHTWYYTHMYVCIYICYLHYTCTCVFMCIYIHTHICTCSLHATHTLQFVDQLDDRALENDPLQSHASLSVAHCLEFVCEAAAHAYKEKKIWPLSLEKKNAYGKSSCVRLLHVPIGVSEKSVLRYVYCMKSLYFEKTFSIGTGSPGSPNSPIKPAMWLCV